MAKAKQAYLAKKLGEHHRMATENGEAPNLESFLTEQELQDALRQNEEKDKERQRRLRGEDKENESDDDSDDEMLGGRGKKSVTRKYCDDTESMEEGNDDDNDSDYQQPTTTKKKSLTKKKGRSFEQAKDVTAWMKNKITPCPYCKETKKADMLLIHVKKAHPEKVSTFLKVSPHY